jgi:hypothetical protein
MDKLKFQCYLGTFARWRAADPEILKLFGELLVESTRLLFDVCDLALRAHI